MKNIWGIIYDCDGVLFDSHQANLAYYNAILTHFGQAPVFAEDREKACLCHTAASPQVLEVLLGPDRAEEALAFAASLDYRRFIPFMTPEPDLAWALSVFSERIPLAVATNRRTSMSTILQHFGLARYFSVVVTSQDVEHPKPQPDMLFLTAKRLNLPVSKLLFVGDSELDREAARQAGIRFVAYKGNVKGDIKIGGHYDLVRMVIGC
jgi:HAD superfamily hydrolase (TIGR01549 family)